MTDIPPDHSVPDAAEGNIEAVPFSVGTALREARAQHGLSVEDVSSRIKFAPRQIEALEADDFVHLPETAFLRGFVRSYARLLQLDPLPLLDALPHEPEKNTVPLEIKTAAEVPYPDIYTERKYNIIWLAAALAVAIVLGLFAWSFGGKTKGHHATPGAGNTQVEMLELPAAVPVSAVPDAKQVMANPSAEKPDVEKTKAVEEPSAEKPSTEKPKAVEKPGTEKPKAVETKSAAQPAPPSPSPVVPPAKPAVKAVASGSVAGQVAIRMTFDGDSWTEITDKDGKVLMGQLNHAGDTRYVNGNPPFTVTLGYASGVKLYYKGKLVELAPYVRAEVAHLTLE